MIVMSALGATLTVVSDLVDNRVSYIPELGGTIGGPEID